MIQTYLQRLYLTAINNEMSQYNKELAYVWGAWATTLGGSRFMSLPCHRHPAVVEGDWQLEKVIYSGRHLEKKKSICLKVCVLMLVTLHSKRHFGQMLHLISGDGRKTQGEATGLAAERRSRTTTSIGNAQRSPRGPDCPEQSPGTLTHTLSAYRSGALFKLKSSIAFLPGSWCKCACF